MRFKIKIKEEGDRGKVQDKNNRRGGQGVRFRIKINNKIRTDIA